jgi:hypothetical protein
MDCSRLTTGEAVGNAPHDRWSPNMLPKQLARGAPLQKKQYITGVSASLGQSSMPVGIVLGMALVVTGLVLLCHLSYTNLSEKAAPDDAEDPAMGMKHAHPRQNDCFVSFCFFQVSQVRNHETWIVACLMTGATVLVLSMV